MLQWCDKPTEPTAQEQDRMLRFAAVVRAELIGSGQRVALVARSGLNLDRIGQRYSHAGISLRDSSNAPWSVRQLYFDCDAARPKLFDEGLAGFLLGTHNPSLGYVSMVLLPEPQAGALADAAIDNRRALGLLGADYSANAYAYSEAFQNCNQWVMEMLASAWAPLQPGAGRRDAQSWLQAQGYEPTVIAPGGRWMIDLAQFIPWIHNRDHPASDLEQARYRISMPVAIERFVQQRLPGAQRLEFCHNTTQIVVRRGWEPLAEGCVAEPGDRVLSLD